MSCGHGGFCMRAMQNKLTLQTISLRQNGDMERIVRTLRTRSLRHNGDNEQIPPPDRIPSVERRASALSALGASGQSARWPSLEVRWHCRRQQGTAFFIGSGNCTFHSHYRCQEHAFRIAKNDAHCKCIASALFSGFDQFTGIDHPVDQFRNPFTGITFSILISSHWDGQVVSIVILGIDSLASPITL